MYVVKSNCLYFLSIFLFTYNKNLLSQKTFRTNVNKIYTLHVYIRWRRHKQSTPTTFRSQNTFCVHTTILTYMYIT